jgi:SAM-dependent methyltransferase
MIHRLFPYDDIAAHLGARIAHHRPGARRILDVACGTGNLTLALARLDYHVPYPCLSVKIRELKIFAIWKLGPFFQRNHSMSQNPHNPRKEQNK